MLGGEPRQCLLVEALLVLVAMPQRLGQELLDVRVEVESPEVLGDRLLAGVFLRAAALVSSAAVAVVIVVVRIDNVVIVLTLPTEVW